MRKGLRGLVDDALSRTGPLAVEKSGDFPTARPFAHQLHQALFGSDKIPEGQNQPYHRSVNRDWQGPPYQRTFSVQNKRGHLCTRRYQKTDQLNLTLRACSATRCSHGQQLIDSTIGFFGQVKHQLAIKARLRNLEVRAAAEFPAHRDPLNERLPGDEFVLVGLETTSETEWTPLILPRGCEPSPGFLFRRRRNRQANSLLPGQRHEQFGQPLRQALDAVDH